MMVTVEIVATFAYKVTEHETFIGKSLKESDLYRTYRRKQRNFTYKSEMYYEFIGSGYLVHKTLGVRIEQDGRQLEYNGDLPQSRRKSQKARIKL